MEIEQEIIGFSTEGDVILRYTITNSVGVRVTLLNIGAAVESISLPEKGDITITYPSYRDYLSDALYMGKCVGRVAGRIAKSRITINDQQYKLSSNEGTTHLNGGISSFAGKLWQARSEKDMVVFSYVSSANEEGYPGEFGLEVGYTLSDDSTLGVTIVGEADTDTVANVAPFIYFTLGDDTELKINSSQYIPLNNKLLPTGTVSDVARTEYDFREFKHTANGEYEEYWLVENHVEGEMNDVCCLRSKTRGVEIEIQSSQRALYYSSCHSIEGCGSDRNGEDLTDGCAVLLSPMAVADADNQNLILRVGQQYHHYTTYHIKTL